MYSAIAFLFFPTVSTYYPLHQNDLVPYLYFRFACLSNIINVLLPLRYPINCDILMCGGILTKRCIWSGQASASIISTPFCTHSFLIISPISFFSCPYISFLLYFGANTIWYWHLYFEWALLFISFLLSFIMFDSSFYFVMQSPNYLHYIWRFLLFARLFGLAFS